MRYSHLFSTSLGTPFLRKQCPSPLLPFRNSAVKREQVRGETQSAPLMPRRRAVFPYLEFRGAVVLSALCAKIERWLDQRRAFRAAVPAVCGFPQISRDRFHREAFLLLAMTNKSFPGTGIPEGPLTESYQWSHNSLYSPMCHSCESRNPVSHRKTLDSPGSSPGQACKPGMTILEGRSVENDIPSVLL